MGVQIPTTLRLVVEQTRCSNVRVVTCAGLYGLEDSPFRKDLEEGRDAPWVTYDRTSNTIVSRVIQWEESRSKAKIGPEILQEMILLLNAFDRAGEEGSSEVFEQTIVSFYEAYGPLFRSGRETSQPLVLFRIYMAFLRWLIVSFGSTLELEKGMPPAVARGEEHLKAWQRIIGSSLSADDDDRLQALRDTSDLPIHRALAETPPMPDSFPSREHEIAWIRQQVVLPALERVVNQELKARLGLTKSGVLETQIRPKDLYTLGLLSFVALNQLQGMHECACGCGQLVPPRRKYVNKTHARRANTKQSVLAVYRARKNRGKISKSAYSRVQEALNKAQKTGVRDKERFRVIAREALNQ